MVKGYKVFNSDWTCRGKQYCCPGTFEEDVALEMCERGMHFCKNLTDCFNYYKFDASIKVAEIVATGNVIECGNKCCTDKIEIVRELTWWEVLDIVNSGNRNSGYGNSGDWNSGTGNSGYGNSGDWNSGNRNSGDWNSGTGNSGYGNSGDGNSGNRNSGDWNSGTGNSGYGNSGDGNSGYGNSGDWNSGTGNSGYGNSGDWNSGNRNSGDWNACNDSAGCFCTKTEKIRFFNKVSDWSLTDWFRSRACKCLNTMPTNSLEWVDFSLMSADEKIKNKNAEICGGYLRENLLTNNARQNWWESLTPDDKNEILSIPNFDAEIFKKITGIDVLKGAKNER